MTEDTPSQRLTRSRDDRVLGGVCGGLAEFIGVDPSLVRVAFVLLSIFGGSGVLLYLVLWLVVPPADDAQRPVDANIRAGVGELRSAVGGIAGDVKAGWRGSDAGDDAVIDVTVTAPVESTTQPAETASQDESTTADT